MDIEIDLGTVGPPTWNVVLGKVERIAPFTTLNGIVAI